MTSRRPFLADWRNAIRDSALPRTTKLVGLVLSTYLDANGTAFPALTTLADGASLGRGCTAVKDAIERLEAVGLLEVDRRRGRLGWTYQAVIPRADVGLDPSGITRPAVGLAAAEIPREPSRKSHANRTEIPRLAVAESAESAESGTAGGAASLTLAATTACPECELEQGRHEDGCSLAVAV